jgi:hypothetical protein
MGPGVLVAVDLGHPVKRSVEEPFELVSLDLSIEHGGGPVDAGQLAENVLQLLRPTAHATPPNLRILSGMALSPR